jgi:tRNA-specific 2-thiouridylase
MLPKYTKNKKIMRVIVGMSGGIDSSVSAALLKYGRFLPDGRQVDVVGVMAKFGNSGENDSEKNARLVAKQIDIPFYIVNLEKEFKKKVIDYFLKEYKAGNTPNPCVVCNKEIKFGLLMEKALKMGGDFIATGHYARIDNGKLLKGKNRGKDQSYFLCQLSQKQLNKILFPVGGYTKSEVRKLAKKFDLPFAEISESQEVCFVQNTTNEFLKKYLKTKPGEIVDKNGRVLGEHNGLWFYTIGQRRGIEVQQGPWYVVDKDLKKNVLIISKNEKDLLKKELIVKNVNWVSGKEPSLCQGSGRQVKLPLSVKVKIRYKSEESEAIIYKSKDKTYKIIFKKPQKSITSGQSAVFYKKDELLGGGIIDKIE